MKIAVIPTIRDFTWGAPGHCMGVLVEALLRAGHEVLWIVAPIDWEHAEVDRLRRAGARTIVLPAAPTSYSRLRSVRQVVERLLSPQPLLEESLKKFCPDHVFLNQGGTWCGTASPLFEIMNSRARRYSVICHSNTPGTPLPALVRARAVTLTAEAAGYFFNSRWSLELAEQQLAASIPAGRTFQVPVRFRFDQPLPWPTNPLPRLAMVSRLDVHTRGMDVALAAVAQLRREGSPFRLGIYGAGHDEQYLRDLIRFWKVEDVVTLHGHADQIEEVWRHEELLLLPSRFEGLSVAMVEALGFGRPVLRTPYGGAAEWIEDGVNGYICPAPEVPLLCATLRRALAERARWPEMGRSGHAKVKFGLHPDPAHVFLEVLN